MTHGRMEQLFARLGGRGMGNYWRGRRQTDMPGKLIMGTIAGMAMGFTAGILTAPRSGKDTRELLSSRTNESLRLVKKGVAETKESVLKAGKEKMEEISS